MLTLHKILECEGNHHTSNSNSCYIRGNRISQPIRGKTFYVIERTIKRLKVNIAVIKNEKMKSGGENRKEEKRDNTTTTTTTTKTTTTTHTHTQSKKETLRPLSAEAKRNCTHMHVCLCVRVPSGMYLGRVAEST